MESARSAIGRWGPPTDSAGEQERAERHCERSFRSATASRTGHSAAAEESPNSSSRDGECAHRYWRWRAAERRGMGSAHSAHADRERIRAVDHVGAEPRRVGGARSDTAERDCHRAGERRAPQPSGARTAAGWGAREAPRPTGLPPHGGARSAVCKGSAQRRGQETGGPGEASTDDKHATGSGRQPLPQPVGVVSGTQHEHGA
jgi:hypothetical protein